MSMEYFNAVDDDDGRLFLLSGNDDVVPSCSGGVVVDLGK